MQTITLKIQDDFMPKFMNILEVLPKSKVKIQKDEITLELEKRIQEIEDGSLPAVPFEKGMQDIRDRLVSKYANR
jgi:hypothetical protein